MKVHFRLLALAACLAALTAVQLPAQLLTGSISGVVTDASGAVLPDATVTASSPAMAGTREVATSAEGAFKILELLPGTYEIRVAKTGFRPVVAQNITLNTGVDVKQDIRMEIGDVSQAVTVEAQAATIDTEHVTLQQVAGQTQMESIPNGRSPWAISGTVPSVTSAAFDVGGSGGMQQIGLTAHGSNTGADQKFMIDGVSVNWPGGGGGATLMYYDMGMFQEVNYIIGAAPADVSQGGVYMNMITKDGSNGLHGSVVAQYASQGMHSNNIDSTLATQLFNNQSATTLARIDKSKVSPGNVILKNYDYNFNLGGAIIKDKLWWFTSERIWGVDNYVAGSFNTDGTQVLNDNRISDEMAKFSYQMNQKNRFSLMYFRNQKNRYHRVNQGLFGDQNSTSVLQNQPGYDADAKWTFVPNSKWVFDVGVALTAGKTPYRYQNAAPAGAISVFDSSLSTVYNIAQYTYLNPMLRVAIDAFGSYYTSNATGNHNFKFGYQYSGDQFNQLYAANGDIQGTFQNGVASTALLYNTPIKEQKNKLSIPAFYAMDTWTIKRRLTLNVGIRWEQWKGSLPDQVSPAGTYVAARNYPGRDVINWKDWTPRFGFSYDVLGKGKTVVKGSFNKFVTGQGMNLLTAVNPLQLLTLSVPWKCSAPDQVTCRNRGPLTSELTIPATVNFSTLLPVFDSATSRPYSYESSFGVQQQLPGGMIVSVMGWYRSTRNQLGRIDVGQPASAYSAINLTNPVTGKPLTLYSAPQKTVDYHIVNSRLLDEFYRGIDINLARRLSKGIMINGGLTYGGNNGATYGASNSNTAGFDDLNNPNYNLNRTGALGVDSTVNFKVNGIYTAPFKIVLAANFQHAGGFPLQNRWALTPANVAAAGGVIPAGTVLGQNGNPTISLASSGYQRLPDVNLMDLRISRKIILKERYKFEPEIDFSNLFNANTVTAVNQQYDAGVLFRNPTGVLFSREVKLGLKFDF